MIQSEINGVYRTFPTEFRNVAVKQLYGNENLADDAMQETLLRAVMKQQDFDPRFGRQGLHAWLLAILRFVCIEMRRKPHFIVESDIVSFQTLNNGEGEIAFGVDSQNTQCVRLTPEADEYAAVDNAIEAKENGHILRKLIALTRMSDIEWACVTAHVSGIPNHAIAADLGIKDRTVSAHIRNTIPRLREAAALHNFSIC